MTERAVFAMRTLFPNMILFSTFTNTYHIENISVHPVRNVFTAKKKETFIASRQDIFIPMR
ncbi:hypothetical protein COOONC_03564 [Cooperia oncophora]